jgi:hypothetical protein
LDSDLLISLGESRQKVTQYRYKVRIKQNRSNFLSEGTNPFGQIGAHRCAEAETIATQTETVNFLPFNGV